MAASFLKTERVQRDLQQSEQMGQGLGFLPGL
jgi:hypothetical protein